MAPTTSTPATEEQRTRLAIAKPWYLRVYSFFAVWTFKTVTTAWITTLSVPPEFRPSYSRSYPSRPDLTAHVFLPKGASSSSPKKYPLMIDVHGGGFVMGSPKMDFRGCADYAFNHGFVVVSLAYRLAPLNPWPAGVHDVAAQMADVLADADLPIDPTRVAVLGYSAGGNLVATAVQLDGLHERIAALVPVYPAADFAVPGDQRLAAATPHPDGRPDMLARSSAWMTWAYVSAGTHLADPLLSPRYADRSKLPKSVWVLGCEYDMLCADDRNMALDLAAQETKATGATIKELDEGDDEGWSCGNVRWRRVNRVVHGFDLMWTTLKEGDERELFRVKGEKMRADIAQWLEQTAFKA